MENLKALIYNIPVNPYQKQLAVKEFEDLLLSKDELLNFVKEMAKRYPNSPWIYEEANKLIKKS